MNRGTSGTTKQSLSKIALDLKCLATWCRSDRHLSCISLLQEMSLRDLAVELSPGYQMWFLVGKKTGTMEKAKRKRSGDPLLLCVLTKPAVCLWASFSDSSSKIVLIGLKDSSFKMSLLTLSVVVSVKCKIRLAAPKYLKRISLYV